MTTPRADGRAPDELRPISFERDFTAMAVGLVPRHASGRPRCSARPRSTRTCPAGCGATARAGSPPSTRCSRVVARADPARGQGRQAVGPHPGDPAAHRPGPAGGVRHAPPRRAPGHRRLRRPAGRRRHPHGVDLRRLRRAARRAARGSCRPGSSPTTRSPRSARRSRWASSDGEPVLDLPYVEDSRAEVDMNVVMTSLGGFVEVQGTAEGAPYSREELDAMLALAETGHRRDHRPAARDGRRAARRRGEAPAPRHGQRAQGRGGRGDPRRPASRSSPSDPGRRGDRRDLRGERAAQGAGAGRRRRASWRWPTTRASRSTTSAARPGSTRPAGPRRTTGSPGCSASSTASTRDGRGCRYVCAAAAVWPDGREEVVRRHRRGSHRRRRPRGTRRLRLRPDRRARRGRRPHVRRDVAGGEAGHQPPRPRLPGARRSAVAAHQPRRSTSHTSTTSSPSTTCRRSCCDDRRVDVGGDHPHLVAHRPPTRPRPCRR